MQGKIGHSGGHSGEVLANIYRWGFHGSKNIADAPGYAPQFISTTHLKK